MSRVANVTREGGRTKVMFQEPLGHAPVGTWITSGDLRYLVTNNRALLDQPGEFVCLQRGEKAELAWIPPAGASPQVPVLARLERVMEVRNVEGVTLQGLNIQHATYRGLDDHMDFQHSALMVLGGTDITIVDCAVSHTEMMGLFISGVNNILVERNVFTDIGTHYSHVRTESVTIDDFPRLPRYLPPGP